MAEADYSSDAYDAAPDEADYAVVGSTSDAAADCNTGTASALVLAPSLG